MRSPTEIAAQIAKLLAEAKRNGRKRGKVIKAIVKQMSANDIALAELRAAMGGKAATAKKTTGKKREKVAVKYDDGKGNTWTGRGRPPRWLVAAETAGEKREQFAVLS